MVVKEDPNMFLLTLLAVVLGCLLMLQHSGDVTAQELQELKQKLAKYSATLGRLETELIGADKAQEMQRKLEQEVSDLKAQISEKEETYRSKMEAKAEEVKQQIAEASRMSERKEQKETKQKETDDREQTKEKPTPASK